MEPGGERGCWGGVKAGEWEEMGRSRVGCEVESQPNWGRRGGGDHSLSSREWAPFEDRAERGGWPWR